MLPTFMNNRVKEIKASPFPISYRYVPTDGNPADLAFRGCSAVDLVENTQWWKGPTFLSTDIWPEFNLPTVTYKEAAGSIEEVNLVSKDDETVQTSSPLDIDATKYSSFIKLVNITCYVKKFIHLCKKQVAFKGPISLDEYEESKVEWLKYIQRKYFAPTLWWVPTCTMQRAMQRAM